MNAGSLFRRAAAGTAAILVLGALATAVMAATPDPALLPAWPQDTALGFSWASGAVPPTAMKTAITAAAADATASRGSRAPSFAYSTSGGNGVSYGTINPCGVNGLACFSRDPAAGYWHLWFRENGHRYDWGTLAWCEMAGSPYGCFKAETITIDELGHVDGLDHHVNLPDDSDYGDAVVQAYSHARPQAGWSATAFGRCDVAALQQLYGPLAWTTPYSTCLDLPTSLTLSASPGTVVTGTPSQITATLRSAGTGRLASNPMAGRTVVLQQWSGTSWADLVTLSPSATAGVYTGAVVPRAAQDFRAVFRKPSNEGVRTSVSNTVRVLVTCPPRQCVLSPGTGPQ